MFVNDLFEGNDKDPCWKGYRQYGMKKKNGKEVPNCVPEGQTTNEVEQRFGEPLTGWHIVYRSSGNPVHGAPSFESKDAAQKYLMTKLFKDHHEFKVVHTAHVGVSESDPSGLLAASDLNKSFIITAELAEGGKKKFRVKAQSERVAREKFSQHYSMAKILSVKEEGVTEAGLKFHGGFPDVDHMPGPVIRDHDFITDNVRTTDKAEWERAVDSINSRVFDDESEFISNSKGKKVVGNGAVWAIWNDEKQVGWFNAEGRPLKTQSVGEAKKIPASNKPVDPKDVVVPLSDVPIKKPRGHKQYDPAKEFPGVKAFKKEGVLENKLSSRDEKDVAAIRAVIQRLESELAGAQPNAPEDWKQDLERRIAHEKKRLGLYGLEESSADSKIASLEKKKQALQNQLELARERRKMRGQRIQSPAETKLSSKISDLGQQIHMLKQGVSEGAGDKTSADYETLAKKHTADGQKGTRANMVYASTMAGRARRAADILKKGGSQQDAWRHYQGTDKDDGIAEGNGTHVKHEKPGSWRKAGYERGNFWAQHSGTRQTKGFGQDRAARDQWVKDQNQKGVTEGAPELLKAEMPLVRHIERELAGHGYEKGTDEYNTMFKHAIADYRKFGNVDLIKKQGMSEGEKKKVQDRKTGEWYDPEEEIEKMYSDPEYVAMVQRMKREEGRGWPKRKEQGVAEGSDKLPGTPVVSLSDFDEKDTKKDKYGRTVPKKLKKDDPRVKFHKDPKQQGVAEGSPDDTNDYYADLYTDLLGQVRNMSLTNRANTKAKVKQDLDSGRVKLPDLKMEIRELDREIKDKKGVAEDNSLTTYVIIYKDEQNQTKQKKVQSTSASQAQAKFEKSYPNYRVVGLKDWEQSVTEGYSLKKTNVDKWIEPGNPDDYAPDIKVKDTDYEIINNKTGQVVGTASWTTNNYFGPGALKITMKNGATRYLDIWEREKGNPQTAFNRFVKDPKTAKKYKDESVAEGSVDKTAEERKKERDQQRTAAAKKARNQAQRKGLEQDKDGTYYGKKGVTEAVEDLIKSVKVGNFRFDLVHHIFGYQVRIYYDDVNQIYSTGFTTNSLEKGLSNLESDVAHMKKVLRRTDEQNTVKESDTPLADLTKVSTDKLREIYSLHRHYGQTNPRSKQAAKRAAEELKRRGEHVPVDEQVANPKDKITVDVPLFLRLMEYAREDAKTDMDLHVVTDRLIELSATGQTLTMQDYSAIVKQNDLEEGTLYPGEYHEWVGQFDDGTSDIIKTYSDSTPVRDAAKKQFPNKTLVDFSYRGIGNMGLTGGDDAPSSSAYQQQQKQIEKGEQFARAERNYERGNK